jgi:phosphopantetheine adenylyltransferase
MYKTDIASNVYKSVERAVTKGLLNGIAIAEDLLKLDPSDMYRLKPSLTLKGLVKLESGLLADVADDVIPAQIKNLKEATTKINELTTALESADELAAPAIKAELDTYLAARNLVLTNKIDEAFDGIDYSNLTFDEFLDEYKALTSELKGKRINNLEKFFSKDIATRKTIAKLLDLINPLNEEVNFADMLAMADDDLKAAFTAKSTTIEALSEPAMNIKNRMLDKMQNKEVYLDIEARKNAANTDNFIKSSANEQAYETLLKRVEDEFGELPEDLKLQFEAVDNETKLLKGWEQASQCLLRGLIDG